MDIDKRMELVKRNTQEIITESELKELLKKKKNPSVYLGTAITGRPHVGYFVWVLKLADFLKAGFKVKLLLADMHGALDNTPWDTLEKRYNYYSRLIPLMFESIDVDIKNFEIVKGSDFQLKKDYMFDVLKVSTFASINDCKRAASEVVKFGDNPKLSGLIYPIMQMLDEQYLDVDIQYGGIDQRKILMFARENHIKVGYKPRIEIMTPLIPGLVGKKMSSSDPKSKIDLLDAEEEVLNKIKNADCVSGDIDNGLLAFLKHVVMIIKKDRNEEFIVERDKKYGGDLSYKEYKDIENDFKNRKLHPLDLKNAVAREISLLLKPMKKHRESLLKLVKEAY
ncbi:MAG: tyrosine--tRNA ligase [Candidatus Nanoarchaeia archaeon]|nr:tyrosine--tRNA ligase [Candidatus Nanoarchaeia archaeon]